MKNKDNTPPVHPRPETPSMRLSRSDKVQLLTTASVVAGTVSLIYLLINYLYTATITYPTDNQVIQRFQHWILYSTPGLRYLIADTMAIVYGVLLILFTVLFTRRRMEQIRLNHILDYISYMADGYYNERIPLKYTGNYEAVADNLNNLMDHIEEALEDQRRSEQTKDELITNIGHDIRTPLTSVIGYLNVLRTSDDLCHEDRVKFTSIAYEKALVMETLINDLFDYTHSMEEKARIDRQEHIPVEAFLDQVAADFALQASKQDIRLTVQVKPESLEASFDPNKLARIFSNLISNALKYGKGARHIKVVAYPRHQGEDVEVITFEVRNDGQLIPEAELDKIFMRSYRGDTSRNSSEPGSGLGLSIVKNFAHLHGGDAYAYIDKNEMVFVVEIPQ